MSALSLLALLPAGHAQLFKDGDIRMGFGINASVGLTNRRSSFYNISAAISVMRDIKKEDFHAMPGVQLTANLYSKGLGTSIFDAYNRRGQVDLVSSFFIIGGYDWDQKTSLKYIRLFNQQSATSIFHNFDAALSYGTSFLINSSGRNQQLGHIGLSADRAMIGYYNDGFWPFDFFASDGFDRYWTGGMYAALGLGMFFPNAPWAQDQFLEYTYERFTGNVQTQYRLSKEMLFNAIPQKELKDAFLNRAFSAIGIRNINGSRLAFGLIGQCTKCDIQDGLHKLLGYSRHISLSRCIPVLIGSFQYNTTHYFSNNGPQ